MSRSAVTAVFIHRPKILWAWMLARVFILLVNPFGALAFSSSPSTLTPEALLSSPRPGVAVPNVPGSHAFYLVTEYSFDNHKTSRYIKIIDLTNGESVALTNAKVEQTSPFWLDDETIAYFGINETQETKLYARPIDGSKSDYVIASFPIDIENPSVHHGKLYFTANVYPDTTLNETRALLDQNEKRHDTAMIYDSVWVRHWDYFLDERRNAIFSIDIRQNAESNYYLLGQETNLLAGSKLEAPISPFGGAEDFAISDKYLAFSAKDPKVNPAWNVKAPMYLIDLTFNDAKPLAINEENEGPTSSPIFSRSGRYLAYLEMRVPQYESDRNRVMIYDVRRDQVTGVTENWDRSPSSISWSSDETKLYLTVEDKGHKKIFELDLKSMSDPIPIVDKHSNSAVYELPDGRIFFTQNSFTSPNTIKVLDKTRSAVTSLTHPPRFNIDAGHEFWFDGVNGNRVHGWIHRPKTIKDKNKKYPMAFLIHGGPQGAWTDSWSTRWNPNVFTSAGFITVAINPTGSTGYGQKFTDNIQGNWGGSPYQELILGYEYVLEHFPEIDADRTAALGASYGGYMVNWIAGHSFARKFKALVTHDGIFSTSNSWGGTEELYFAEKEFRGLPWDKGSVYEKWNPANHVANWRTPHLIIHSAKDFRLAETEGISAFNTLQRLGVKSRLVYFPDENHWVLKPANSLVWHRQVLGWIKNYTNLE